MRNTVGEKRALCSRRSFLEKSSVLAGAMVVKSLIGKVPISFAKDIYPAEKIKWLIPYKPGGGFDLLARGVSPYVTKYLGEGSPGAKGGGIVLKNEPAAQGQKAYNMVYNAPPDGYTIGGFDVGFVTETLLGKLDFDLNKFTYLLRAMSTTRLIVTRKNGFANWEEMIKFAKTRELKWGTGSYMKSTQIESIIVTERAGITARYIPWGGTAECMNALMRGDVLASLVSEDSVKGLLDSGEIRVLTVLAQTSKYPGIPTIKELGYPDLIEKMGAHRFVIAPPSLPNPMKNPLISAFKKSFNDAEFKNWARNIDIPLNPLFGEQAEAEAKRIFKYYQNDVKPIVLKYAK
jgi:tripartite-type tricarboxylate transporter receptor subunit TctC